LHYAAAYGWIDCINLLLKARDQTNKAKRAIKDLKMMKIKLKKDKEEATKAKI